MINLKYSGLTITLFLLTGYSSCFLVEKKAILEVSSACCPCDESGYYYNGHQENGWRYCLVPQIPDITLDPCKP